MMTDPISDMLTRLRNAHIRDHATASVPFSKMKEGVLGALMREGYIQGYEVKNETLEVTLKYYNGQPVIRSMKRISKPGCRVYSKIKDLPRANNGLGIYVLSTSRGIMPDSEARQENIGGEVLCTVF
jgi:small subunit ribosomal protein S8